MRRARPLKEKELKVIRDAAVRRPLPWGYLRPPDRAPETGVCSRPDAAA
jgi:hypothetical protein